MNKDDPERLSDIPEYAAKSHEMGVEIEKLITLLEDNGNVGGRRVGWILVIVSVVITFRVVFEFIGVFGPMPEGGYGALGLIAATCIAAAYSLLGRASKRESELIQDIENVGAMTRVSGDAARLL